MFLFFLSPWKLVCFGMHGCEEHCCPSLWPRKLSTCRPAEGHAWRILVKRLTLRLSGIWAQMHTWQLKREKFGPVQWFVRIFVKSQGRCRLKPVKKSKLIITAEVKIQNQSKVQKTQSKGYKKKFKKTHQEVKAQQERDGWNCVIFLLCPFTCSTQMCYPCVKNLHSLFQHKPYFPVYVGWRYLKTSYLKG